MLYLFKIIDILVQLILNINIILNNVLELHKILYILIITINFYKFQYPIIHNEITTFNKQKISYYLHNNYVYLQNKYFIYK